jgi:hypothetical protein
MFTALLACAEPDPTSVPSPSDTATGTPTEVGTTPGPDPAAVLFEEDFDGGTVGAVPDGWDTFVGWVVNNGQNTPDASVFALVDDDRARSGRALHVRGGANPAQITRPLPDGADRLYVRAWVWPTVQLGASPGRNHETLIGLRAGSGTASDEVRFGEIKGVIGTNEVPSDDISPLYDQWGEGPTIAPDGWRCVEVAFLGDGDSHEVHAWRDGEEVHAIDDPSQWNNRVLGETFLDGKFGEVVLGWHSFSNLDHELWFDDVVVATERIGCAE